MFSPKTVLQDFLFATPISLNHLVLKYIHSCLKNFVNEAISVKSCLKICKSLPTERIISGSATECFARIHKPSFIKSFAKHVMVYGFTPCGAKQLLKKTDDPIDKP